MSETQSFLCPRCGKLISRYLAECSHCGLVEPYRQYRLRKALRLPSLVKALIWLCGGLFGLSFLLPLLLGGSIQMGRGMLGLPAPSGYALHLMGWATTDHLIRGEYYPLVTAVFLHGGLLHIIFNMLWLRDLGRLTEQIFNPAVMLTLFVVTGVAGNLLAVSMPFVWASMGMSARPVAVLGASGAVFGLMGALIAFSRKLPSFQARTLARQLGTWAIVIILLGFMMPQVSNAGHIGGFVAGWALGKLLPVRVKRPHLFDLMGLASAGLVVYSFAQVALR